MEISKLLKSNLTLRVVSALVMLPIVLAAIYFGGWAFAIFTLAVIILVASEWVELVGKIGNEDTPHPVLNGKTNGGVIASEAKQSRFRSQESENRSQNKGEHILRFPFSGFRFLNLDCFASLAMTREEGFCRYFVLPSLLTIIAFIFLSQHLWGWTGVFASIAVGAVVIWLTSRFVMNFPQPVWLAMGVPYLGIAMASFLWLRVYSPNAWMADILFVFIVVWATDIGAYFIGKAIGGPKLAPRISPKKTWAGFFGGVICAALVGAIAWKYMSYGSRSWLLYGASLGAIFSVAGQLGDLFKSIVKRKAGVKDSGALIPGHGGVLDRVDGLLFAVPAAVLGIYILLWIYG